MYDCVVKTVIFIFLVLTCKQLYNSHLGVRRPDMCRAVVSYTRTGLSVDFSPINSVPAPFYVTNDSFGKDLTMKQLIALYRNTTKSSAPNCHNNPIVTVEDEETVITDNPDLAGTSMVPVFI